MYGTVQTTSTVANIKGVSEISERRRPEEKSDLNGGTVYLFVAEDFKTHIGL
jgi:hypothetical protein